MKKLTGIILISFILLSACSTVLAAEIKDIYVDCIRGSDSAAGTAISPLATIAEAKRRVSKINSDMKNDITVNIASGTYALSETMIFDEKDSGSNGYKIIYKGLGETTPVISGGKRITGWKLYDSEKNIYSADTEGLDARAFFVNGKCAVRARSENNFLNERMNFTSDKKGYVTDYTEIAEWKNQSEIEFVYANYWATPRVFVNKITVKDNKAYISINSQMSYIIGLNYMTAIRTNPLYIENAFELLDEKGEFYINRGEKKIYYIPRDGEDLKTAEAYLPCVENVVKIQGSSKDSKVSGIEFQNISFKHCDWMFISKSRGIYDRQANIPMRWLADGRTGEFTNPGLVDVKYAENIAFKDCEFSLSAASGLVYRQGVQNSPIMGNYVHDIYGTGISVGEVNESSYFSAPGDKNEYSCGNHILNNIVTDTGKVYEGSCGIFLGYVSDMKIWHNDVSYIPYSALSLGWGWAQFAGDGIYANDTQGTVIRDVSIKYNYIHDIGIGYMVDGGGIYMLGATGGSLSDMNECSENYIRNIGKLCTALYPDEGSTYWKFDKNVIDIDANSIGGYNTQVRWTHLHQPTIYHIQYDHNFTTTENHLNNATATVIKNTVYVPDRNWDSVALAIIKNAGVEADFVGKFKGKAKDRNAPSRIECADTVDVRSGQSIGFEITVYNDYSELISDAAVKYEVEDSTVCTVDSTGIHGLKQGKTEIKIIAEKYGNTAEKSVTVYVDDAVKSIVPQNNDSEFVIGDRPNFKVKYETIFGRFSEEPETEFFSDNPEIMTVDSTGKGNALKSGSCKITAKVKFLGKYTEYVREIAVNKSSIFDISKYKTVDMGSVFNDLSNWNTVGTASKQADKKISLKTPGGYSIYAGKKYGNEILNYDFYIDADGGWPTFLLRAQEAKQDPLSGNTAYFVGLKSDCIELQMFKKGVRTLYYGTLDGYEALAGGAVKNVYYKFRERNNIKLGAINEKDGVRIIVVINGNQVINYLDRTENAITDRGYFGTVMYEGAMILQEPSEISKTSEAENDLTDVQKMIQNGYITYDEAENIKNNGGVTKGEFIAFVIRAMGYGNIITGLNTELVSEGPYKNNVITAIDRGLVSSALISENGINCGEYITREEAASVIVNALKEKRFEIVKGDLSQFKDCLEVSEWAVSYMQYAIGSGIFIGDGSSSLFPREKLSLEAAAAVLARFVLRIS